MAARARVPGQRRTQAPKEVAVIVTQRTSHIAPSHTSPPPAAHETSPIAIPPAMEEIHWVYATVGAHNLCASGDSNDIVCVKQSRVLLLYPMVADSDTGIVSMKVKRVDSGTGQLELRWVDVYDPNTDTRYVSQFSMVP